MRITRNLNFKPFVLIDYYMAGEGRGKRLRELNRSNYIVLFITVTPILIIRNTEYRSFSHVPILTLLVTKLILDRISIRDVKYEATHVFFFLASSVFDRGLLFESFRESS